VAHGNGEVMSVCGVENGKVIRGDFGPGLHARFAMAPGDKKVLVTRWNTEEMNCDVHDSLAMMQRTMDIWSEWAHREGRVKCRTWAGTWSTLVTRSALVFKLLTHADTGAIAAAPTASLPETIGGVRNWDYRYTWIRDASLSAQALISMGHSIEAVELLYWMERVSEARFKDRFELQIMYGLHGESDLEEFELDHLEGYKGSRPVHIGNEAAEQFQLETFGELLSTGYELVRRGEELDSHLRDFLRSVTEIVTELWDKPDQGIWELRGKPRHFTYSKVMAWVALDKAIYLAERYGLPGDVEKWRNVREAIREQVLERGYDKDLGSFVLAYGSQELDAANLRIPLLEFLPIDDPRVQGTIDRTMEYLMKNSLVYRYRMDDGLPGEEGAFGLCTFWLVDALALSNRLDEAREIFEKIAGRANHAGLFPEQFDPVTGHFLGNFPQAFTHIGLINSALYLAYAEGRDTPEHAPVGTPAHRESIMSFYGTLER
jgi:GH15 family glucan-1,4-alpha-glucosidase